MDNIYGNVIDPEMENLTPQGIKGTRCCHKITNQIQTIGPRTNLYVDIPKLEVGTLIVPNTFCITFDLELAGDPWNTIVDNVAKSIFRDIRFDIGDEKLFSLDRADVYFIFKDLFISKLDRENMIYEGIQSDKLRKLRIEPQTKPAETDATAVAIYKIFKNRYRYYFDIDFFKVPVYPYLINQNMRLTLYLNDISHVINTIKWKRNMP